jgi:hypothetical protein
MQAAFAATAACMSEGSFKTPDGLEIPNKETATPRAVVRSITLTAAGNAPEKADECYQRFLALGFEVATGANRWSDPLAQPTPTAEAPTVADATTDDQHALPSPKRSRHLQWD